MLMLVGASRLRRIHLFTIQGRTAEQEYAQALLESKHLVRQRKAMCASKDMMILYLLFATNGSKHIPLFLKRDGGSGEGKNFFSREKKFFPSPGHLPYREFRVPE